MFRTILVALDGDAHTQRALAHALDLSRRHGATLIGLHVMDSYLKRFHNEIYAVGRQEYLDHVDRCLREGAERILREFQNLAEKEDVRAKPKLRHGDPLEEIVEESRSDEVDLLIIGGKRLHGFDRWRSGNLPEKLAAIVETPLLIVRQ